MGAELSESDGHQACQYGRLRGSADANSEERSIARALALKSIGCKMGVCAKNRNIITQNKHIYCTVARVPVRGNCYEHLISSRRAPLHPAAPAATCVSTLQPCCAGCRGRCCTSSTRARSGRRLRCPLELGLDPAIPEPALYAIPEPLHETFLFLRLHWPWSCHDVWTTNELEAVPVLACLPFSIGISSRVFVLASQ